MLKLIPSRAHRWVPCPGSAKMEEPFPRGPSNPVTEQGIALDWAVDQVILAAPLCLHTLRGMEAPNGVVIDDEMVWAGNVYIADVWSVAREYPEGLEIQKALGAGRADAFWRSMDGTRAVIWDMKFGYTPVDAYRNWQLMCYAMQVPPDDAVGSFDLRIVQPRGTSASDPVKRWAPDSAEYITAANTVVDAQDEAVYEHPTTHAGRHCLDCRAAAHCETLGRAADTALSLSGQSIPEDMDSRQIAYQLQLMAQAESLVKARKRALEASAVASIEGGQPIPGYGVKSTLGNRKWGAPDDQIYGMGWLGGVDLSEVKPCSPRQAETRGVPADLVNMYTTRVMGAAKLAAIDPREAREVFRNE